MTAQSDFLSDLDDVVKDYAQIVIAQIDPDAIGAALGLAHLINAIAGPDSARIFYAGRVGHPQNEALCNKFDLMSKFQPVAELESFITTALVDSSKLDDSRLPSGFDYQIVIDHHRGHDLSTDREDAAYWIDGKVGSASTMVVELLELRDQILKVDSATAHALALGIYTDTKSLVRGSPRDRNAFGLISEWAPSLPELINYSRPFSYLQTLSACVSKIQADDSFRNGRMITGLGMIEASRGDDLAMIADELLRTQGCSLAVTWGIVDGHIRVCARSSDLTINLGDLLSKRFGKRCGAKMLPDGAGEGGALMQLDSGFGEWLTDAELVKLVGRRLREWLFEEDAA